MLPGSKGFKPVNRMFMKQSVISPYTVYGGQEFPGQVVTVFHE